ncbi:SusC/RagA family TonB-linked outer membrane protein [Mucilaginibacter daejeonensis]|uniref:SusC/RagA family TonB-linked outer membrane protein n=1 Tax=Mucilaginibacter daejeonensis TaxID=398049 RepID=UPI001D17AAB4|nr:SusC/RagA family TonB-linked outer membrane protein [Mucilaginibacter daejeonensis]UEG52266.1 SusC/RagA family TonB-linked outer membrane protein [Mucilaginibacter daejeonensis]
MISFLANAQTFQVRGKVVDEKNEPLAGATVSVTGTTTATSATVSGDFTLSVPAGTRSVTISFIGYNEQVKPVSASTANLGTITLNRSGKDLNEVVVVGYGTLRKQDVTGTVVNVDAKTLQEIPASNFVEQLKGRVAGVDVVSGSNGPIVSIRGNRTIGAAPGTDGPLIVLDGQPYYASIENINPADIKSIDVLKGASATAIYGTRGSGGVLLVTTNRGRVGQTVTSYDSYVGVSKLEGSLELLNGQQFAQLQKDALAGAVLQNNSQTNPYSLTAIEQQALNQGVSTDYVDLLLKRSMIWDQSLRVASGTERTQFTVGAGYRLNTGLQPNNSTKRVSLNATLDHKINRFLKFGLSTQTTVRMINAGGGDQLLTARYMSPLTFPYNPDGSINPTPQSDQIDATLLNPLYPGANPDQYYDYTRGFQHNDIVYGEVSPVDHFKYRYTFNYGFNQSLQGTYRGINNVDIVNATRTTASTTNNYRYRLAQEHLLTYDNTFAQKHHVNLVGVYRAEKQHDENSNINATGIPFDAVKNSNLGLATTIAGVGGSFVEQGLVSYIGRLNYAYDDKYDLTASITRDGNSALGSENKYTSYPSIGLGWVISNESFMKKYAFINNLKLRGGYGITSTTNTIFPYNTLGALSSSKYQYGGASTGNAQGVRVTTLTNPTLTWQRTHEYNLALDFGLFKNRLTGSVEVYKQRTTGIILPNILPITNGSSAQVTNLGTSANKGLEITLSSINLQNVGGFTWSTDANLSFSRERIVELPNGAPLNINSGLFVGQPLSVIYDVKKIGIWQLGDSPGIDASKSQANGPVYLPVRGQTGTLQYPGQIRVQDVNGDGKIDQNDNQIIGNFQPKYQFGLTNRFSYKNFDLSIVIQGRMKFTTLVPYVSSANSAYIGWQYLNTGRHNQPVLDYWTMNNPTNAFPTPNAQGQGNYYSTLQYYDGSWIRAKSINFGYNLPSSLTKRIGMSSLRIYANVTNPFIIYAPIMNHSFTVTDPESVYNQQVINSSTSGNAAGQDGNNNNYRGLALSPGLQTRDFILGINARF